MNFIIRMDQFTQNSGHLSVVTYHIGGVRYSSDLTHAHVYSNLRAAMDAYNVLKTFLRDGERLNIVDCKVLPQGYGFETSIVRTGPNEESIIEEALNVAVAHIQKALGQTDGDNAGDYFSDLGAASEDWQAMTAALRRYVDFEWACMIRDNGGVIIPKP